MNYAIKLKVWPLGGEEREETIEVFDAEDIQDAFGIMRSQLGEDNPEYWEYAVDAVYESVDRAEWGYR